MKLETRNYCAAAGSTVEKGTAVVETCPPPSTRGAFEKIDAASNPGRGGRRIVRAGMNTKKSALSFLLLSSTLGLATACGSDDDSPNNAGTGASGGSAGSSASGGSGNASGGSGNASGDGESCAEVAECCTELSSDLQPSCEIAVDTGDESTCAAALLAFNVQGYCTGEEPEDPTGGLPPVELDGAWDSASTAVGSGALPFERPEMQICGEGDVIAVWRNESEPVELVSVRFESATGTWTPLGTIDENNGLYAVSPKLASNADCDAIVLWFDALEVLNGDDEYTLTASRLAGNAWGAPFVIEKPFQSEMSRHALFVDPGGSAEFGYEANAPDPYQPGRRLIGDGSADPKVELGTLEVSGTAFGMLPSGEGLFLVSEYDEAQASPVDNFLRAFTRSAAGEWSDASELETVPDVRKHDMQVVPAGDRFYLHWENTNGESFFGVQTPGEPMMELETPTDFDLYDVRFAAHGDVLFAYGFGEDGAQAARFTIEGGWEAPAAINAEKHTYQNDFAIVVDSAGRATAVYSVSDAGVFANRFTPEEGWRGPHAIDIHGSDASIGLDAAGRVFIGYLVFESTGFLTGTNNFTLRRFVPNELL